MSHYTLIETEIRKQHQDCLLKALQEMPTRIGRKWTREDIKLHAKPVRLTGYRGDKREQVAHIVIPREKVGKWANDLGIEWGPDGKARLHISEYDSGFYGQKWQGKLAQRYAVHVARKTAPMGYQVTETEREDGTVVLEMRRA